jgi:hypothetical protein
LGPRETYNINPMISIKKRIFGWATVKHKKGFGDLRDIDNVTQMMTLIVITLSNINHDHI